MDNLKYQNKTASLRFNIFGWFIWYYTDYKNSWIRFGTPWKTLSYSKSQGFMILDSQLFKGRDINGMGR